MNGMIGKDGRSRILLVDDVPANLRALADILATSYELQFASSGAEALRLLRQAPLPDLIVLDVMMPGVDGYTVCREIRRNPATQSIPVIFITALDEPADEILGLEVGAADYIAKPFDPGIALARIRNQLRQKIAADRLRDAVPVAVSGADGNRFRRHGASWEIAFRGKPAIRVKDAQGLSYLQCLLTHPGREFLVEELVFLAVPKERERLLANAASRLDESALNFYRVLTPEILAQPGQAGGCRVGGILGGTVEQLLGELRRDGILGQGASLTPDDRERFRKSVGNAIRRALHDIAAHDTELAAHLQLPALRLGCSLMYAPATDIFWTV